MDGDIALIALPPRGIAPRYEASHMASYRAIMPNDQPRTGRGDDMPKQIEQLATADAESYAHGATVNAISLLDEGAAIAKQAAQSAYIAMPDHDWREDTMAAIAPFIC